MIGLALIATFVSFLVSASAGLGGSLVLVPALVVILGAKSGVATAALLLAANNVAKVYAYRRSVPVGYAVGVSAATLVGAVIGARLLIWAPESWVRVGVAASIALTLFFEWRGLGTTRRFAAWVAALGAGATSGFSGTSGPLKGIALRNLALDRLHLVGAASLVSLVGDLGKSLVFFQGGLLAGPPLLLWAAIPLIPVATWLGRRINQKIGERAYAGLFWAVMTGYTVRVLFA